MSKGKKMKMFHVLLLLLLLLFALPSSSFGAEVTLSSESDFIDFVDKVNTETTYSGDTIYLGSDIALSGNIDPIGNNTYYYFLGTFDGQGHVISGLKIESSLEFTGLFGYSEGLTIRNVVLDGSCSITSTTTSGSGYVGGIIGYCYANSEECSIENSVNMADVSFSGSISGDNLYIGGIVGRLDSSSSNSVHVKNCVNYGSVTDSGTVNNYYAEIGGIVGISTGSSSNYIQNCLNYGTITHSGTSTYLYIGGVVGNGAPCTYIENCVSAGKISTPTTASSRNYVGSVVGKVNTGMKIHYCYYTSDANVNSINGYGTPALTGTSNSTTPVNSELLSKLNSNATSCSWSKWFMLHLNGGRINNLTQKLLIEIQRHIPGLVKEGNSFLFWCKDVECTEVFNPETESVSGITDLYAGWASGIVTFDFGNGTAVKETFTYNTEVIYPNNLPEKEGYTLSWDNYHELMPARDITITAQWTPNNYTVTFDANDGDVSETSKVVTFDEKYGVLPKSKRDGFMFIGWFTEKTGGTEVTNETIITTPGNHTLYAHWEEVTTQVEIVFNTKDLTKEEVRKLVEQYTNANFTIAKFENETGEIRAIIKFTDKEDADVFVRNIKESSKAMDTIKKISFDQGNDNSFSTTAYPLLFLGALFL